MIKLLHICFLFLVSSSQLFSQAQLVQTWYDSSQNKLKERYYIISKKNSNHHIWYGTYLSYFQNGHLESKGNYSNNRANGYWVYFYDNGRPKSEGMMKDDITTGKWRYYFENGNLSMEGMMIDSRSQGNWKFFYENKVLKKTGNYKNGVPFGIWKSFYENGALKSISRYENNAAHFEEFYPDSVRKAEGRIVNSKSDSLWHYYYPNGKLKATGYEKEGLKHGKWFFYHDNGLLASEGIYYEGKTKGDWKYFYDNGKLSAEGIEENGKKEGDWKLYYETGEFKASGNFANGNGNYSEFYESGKLKLKGFIENAKSEGDWKYFYETGESEGTCTFKNGEGYFKGYHINGNLKTEGILKDGEKVGVWKLYNEKGKFAGLLKTIVETDTLTQPDTSFSKPPVIILNDTTSLEKKTISPNLTKVQKRKSKQIKYFFNKSDEYKSFIFSMNPFGLIFNTLPIYFEYYLHEHMGFELGFIPERFPLISAANSIAPGILYKQGISVFIRQKFYQKHAKGRGMIYFAHEFRITSNLHSVNIIPSTMSGINTISATENLYMYSVLLGDRFLNPKSRKGFTLDLHIGFGIGYREYNKQWSSYEAYDSKFAGIVKDAFAYMPRLGFSFGYIF